MPIFTKGHLGLLLLCGLIFVSLIAIFQPKPHLNSANIVAQSSSEERSHNVDSLINETKNQKLSQTPASYSAPPTDKTLSSR